MNFIHYGQTFLNRGPLYPSHSTAPHCSAKKKIPTDADTSAKQLKFRPIPPNHRATKDWTAIAWPTNIQSKTPDGKFGPAVLKVWGDCWFLAAMAAVANDPNGHKILAKSIKKIKGGYNVTFKGSPNTNVFISDDELKQLLKTRGGDADTRLLELAAYHFFSIKGNFQSMFLAALMKAGLNRETAEQCFKEYCEHTGIQDPMMHNAIRDGGENYLACFMFTGMFPDTTFTGPFDDSSSATLQSDDAMRFLNQYATNDRDGASVTIRSLKNPLGENADSCDLVLDWDVIRTVITRDSELSVQEQTFLKALDKWLETRNSYALQALKSAVGNLRLRHINLVKFVERLVQNLFQMNHDHFNVLRSAVQEVLNGGTGYIGFVGGHAGTIERIDQQANTFTYSEPNCPTLIHTGELSGLIQEIISGKVYLSAVKLPTEQDTEKRFDHGSTSRGRRLLELHNQVVRDGKIDQTESAPLADLMEMDDGAFRQVYDSDQNGLIEGDELKAVQLRVDRWVEHLELTPIW